MSENPLPMHRISIAPANVLKPYQSLMYFQRPVNSVRDKDKVVAKDDKHTLKPNATTTVCILKKSQI